MKTHQPCKARRLSPATVRRKLAWIRATIGNGPRPEALPESVRVGQSCLPRDRDD